MSGIHNPKTVLDVVGKIWALPNTALGLVYGGVGHLAEWIMSTNLQITFGNNAILFLNNPLMKSGMSQYMAQVEVLAIQIDVSSVRQLTLLSEERRFGIHSKVKY